MAMQTVWVLVTVGMEHSRSRYGLLLLGGLFACLMPLAHFTGKGLSAALVGSDGALFFITVLFVLGISGPASVLLAAKGLWSLRGKTRS